MKKRIFILLTIVTLITAAFFAYRSRAAGRLESKALRNFKLTVPQGEAIANFDKALENLAIQYNETDKQKKSVAVGFAISLGIAGDDLKKFQLVKKDDGYYLEEVTESK